MKTKFLLAFAVVLGVLSFRNIGQTNWNVDAYHSQLGFSVNLFMVSDLKGSFKITESKIVAPKGEDFSDASVTLVADINSIDTDNDDRDSHLRSADYFDVKKFPTATFKSTSFKKVADGKYKITGDLTMHGITKPLSLDAIIKIAKHPAMDKNVSGFKVTGVINRRDYGIAISTPAAMLADEVMLEANLQYTPE